jgi:uncharacterized membrane protein YfcA
MCLVGVTLGLLGSGGSVLTVPLLVYGLGLSMPQATSDSLFVVGITSIAGAWTYWRRELVSVRVAAWFAIPSLISVYWTRAILVPHLPAESQRPLMIAFAVLMTVAAVAMIRRRAPDAQPFEAAGCKCPALMAEGFGVGLIAGLFGAGGGFLIVPALVLLGRLPMKLAVGTSLTVISLQSLTGFAGSYHGGAAIDWPSLARITAAALTGLVVGLLISPRLAAHSLRSAFGWSLLVAGIAIAARELLNPGY